jgi:hypothetical protein
MMMKKIKINLFLIFVYLNKINNMINYNNNDMEIIFSKLLMPSQRHVMNECDTSLKLMGDQKISLTSIIGGLKS